MQRPIKNPKLSTIKKNWAGNPLTPNGLYTNLDQDDIRSLGDVFSWMTGPRPLTKLKKGQKSPLHFQVCDDIHLKETNVIIPLGHAGFIIDIQNTRMIIDPVIVHNRFLKRHTPIPVDVHLLTNVDYILLSHNHRDHIDKDSIKKLCSLNPKAIILTGLEVSKLLRRWSIKNEIHEAGWYQTFNTVDSVAIHFLPAKHWTRRWITDTNQNLWGSFVIQDVSNSKTIYFASDSGYGQHFSEIGSMFDIDIAMIGIGAYEPRWFMGPIHMGPDEALVAVDDLKARQWMPMHYGTFDLSDEPIFYPEEVLRKEPKFDKSRVTWMEIGKRIMI